MAPGKYGMRKNTGLSFRQEQHLAHPGQLAGWNIQQRVFVSMGACQFLAKNLNLKVRALRLKAGGQGALVA